MRIRQNTTLRLLATLLLAHLAGCGGEPAHPANLLFLCVDTLRADHLGTYGGDVETPAIDALARESVVFENAISHASWTLPSFAAVLTSTYTSTNGCRTKESRLKGGLTTLPETLSAAGYDTFGIATHIFFREEYGLQQGFDAFDVEVAYARAEKGWRQVTSPHVAERARAFLEQRRASGDADPFLLFLHYFDPHLPYVDHRGVGPGPETEHARYESEIAYTDRFVGAALDALEATGFADDTIVVFLSDHGEAFEEHPGVRRHARSLFREELTVPLLLRVPGVAPRRVADIVRTVDLLPTLLELLRLPVPAGIEGVSLGPALRGESFDAPPLLAEIELHEDQLHRRAVVEDGWKLIETTEGESLLFELGTDPLERADRAGSEPERVRAMRATLAGLVKRAEELGALFAEEEAVETSPEVLEQLERLGYAGEADSPE